jgi:Family of unknown function (DUF5719)
VADAAAGVTVRGRSQLVAAILVAAIAVGAGAVLQQGVGTKAFAGPPPLIAPSGAWFCPHGGGTGWRDTLEVANPGESPVRIRVTRLTEARPGSPRVYTVGPGAELLLPGRSDSRAASSTIEYFGGWVAAAWVSRAGGDEGGVAAEPCSPTAGRRWFLPDGSTRLAEDATAGRPPPTLDSWVVVMNPFAADAVLSLVLYTDHDPPVRVGAWTNIVLKPFHSRAFYLNDQRLGYSTVATSVEAKIGRVVASSLDVSAIGGARAALGELAPVPPDAVLPGGFDQGRSELVVMNPTSAQVQTTGTVLGRSDPRRLETPDEGRADPESAQTFPLTTEGPTSVDVRLPTGAAVVRRTYGQSSDQAATGPGVPARRWVILPAIGGKPSHAGAVVANPGPQAIDIHLSYLPSGTDPAPEPITMHVPGMRAVAVPSAFVEERPMAAILAVASDGAFVPVAASYSLGRDGLAGYAVSRGVPIPEGWVPATR